MVTAGTAGAAGQGPPGVAQVTGGPGRVRGRGWGCPVSLVAGPGRGGYAAGLSPGRPPRRRHQTSPPLLPVRGRGRSEPLSWFSRCEGAAAGWVGGGGASQVGGPLPRPRRGASLWALRESAALLRLHGASRPLLEVAFNGGENLHGQLGGTESWHLLPDWSQEAKGGRQGGGCSFSYALLLSGSFGHCPSQGNTVLLSNP